ncbi:hypothetical protein BJV74DRAFT_887520 [Russula compacta]|nr:hypothetical protein BJV74DRAFT_887520 [Russula compacta]
MPDADLSLIIPAIFFSSVGTTRQRCIPTRWLYLHDTITPEFLVHLQTLYTSPVFNPIEPTQDWIKQGRLT